MKTRVVHRNLKQSSVDEVLAHWKQLMQDALEGYLSDIQSRTDLVLYPVATSDVPTAVPADKLSIKINFSGVADYGIDPL